MFRNVHVDVWLACIPKFSVVIYSFNSVSSKLDEYNEASQGTLLKFWLYHTTRLINDPKHVFIFHPMLIRNLLV